MLKIENLTIKYEKEYALKTINLELGQGELVALVGHNGAGKSTLFRAIMGLIEKEEGHIHIAGHSIADDYLAYKRKVCYVPEQPFLLNELTTYQHVELYLESYGLDLSTHSQSLNHYLNRFEIQDKTEMFPTELSKGMRQKLQLICGFIVETDLLIIDEPFLGLDPEAQGVLIDLLVERKRKGKATLLTTHQLQMLTDIADRYIMLQNGRVVETGLGSELSELRRRF